MSLQVEIVREGRHKKAIMRIIFFENQRSEQFLWLFFFFFFMHPIYKWTLPCSGSVSSPWSVWLVWSLLGGSSLKSDIFWTEYFFKGADGVCLRRKLLRQAPSVPWSSAEEKLIAVGKGKLVVSYYMLCRQDRRDAIQIQWKNQWLPFSRTMYVLIGINEIWLLKKSKRWEWLIAKCCFTFAMI